MEHNNHRYTAKQKTQQPDTTSVVCVRAPGGMSLNNDNNYNNDYNKNGNKKRFQHQELKAFILYYDCNQRILSCYLCKLKHRLIKTNQILIMTVLYYFITSLYKNRIKIGEEIGVVVLND